MRLLPPLVGTVDSDTIDGRCFRRLAYDIKLLGLFLPLSAYVTTRQNPSFFFKSTYVLYSSKLTATSKNPSVYRPRKTLPFIRISPISSSVRQFCSTLRLWAFTAQWLSKSVTFFKKLLLWLSSAWKSACSFTIAAQVQLQLNSAVGSRYLCSNPDSSMQLAWLFWDP